MEYKSIKIHGLKEEYLLDLGEAVMCLLAYYNKTENRNADIINFKMDGNSAIEYIELDGQKIEDEETIEKLIRIAFSELSNKTYSEDEMAIKKTISNISHHLLSQSKEEDRKIILQLLSTAQNSALIDKISTQEATKKAKEAIQMAERLNYLVF